MYGLSAVPRTGAVTGQIVMHYIRIAGRFPPPDHFLKMRYKRRRGCRCAQVLQGDHGLFFTVKPPEWLKNKL